MFTSVRCVFVCARACKWGCVYLHRPRRSLPRLSYRFDGLISLLLPLPTNPPSIPLPLPLLLQPPPPPPPPPVSSFSLFFRKSERRWVEQSERIHGHCVSITVCVMVSSVSSPTNASSLQPASEALSMSSTHTHTHNPITHHFCHTQLTPHNTLTIL